jgi:hypothetical protein
MLLEHPEMADLGRRHGRQGGPATEGRCGPRVLGQAVERGQLAVRQHAEQVDGRPPRSGGIHRPRSHHAPSLEVMLSRGAVHVTIPPGAPG